MISHGARGATKNRPDAVDFVAKYVATRVVAVYGQDIEAPPRRMEAEMAKVTNTVTKPDGKTAVRISAYRHYVAAIIVRAVADTGWRVASWHLTDAAARSSVGPMRKRFPAGSEFTIVPVTAVAS